MDSFFMRGNMDMVLWWYGIRGLFMMLTCWVFITASSSCAGGRRFTWGAVTHCLKYYVDMLEFPDAVGCGAQSVCSPRSSLYCLVVLPAVPGSTRPSPCCCAPTWCSPLGGGWCWVPEGFVGWWREDWVPNFRCPAGLS